MTLALFLGLALLIVGFLGFFVSSTYTVRIASAGGDSTALLTKDKEYAMLVVSALNEAIVRRG